MPASEARILANQANARLSTGPKTAEGKEQSRANDLNHGMTGAGVVEETFKQTLASFFQLEKRAAALEARYPEPAPMPPSKAPRRFESASPTPIEDIFDVPFAIGRRR